MSLNGKVTSYTSIDKFPSDKEDEDCSKFKVLYKYFVYLEVTFV